jgi:pSer/pThr/pTyr-binding forkhead associated (FHA) protein
MVLPKNGINLKMSSMICPKCNTPVTETMLVCPKCATLLFDPQLSTVHMRVDPRLLRLRRVTDELPGVTVNEQTVLLQMRGMVERLIFEEGTEIVLGRADLSQPNAFRFDTTMYGGLERGVSREHAVLRLKEGKLTITDLKSANGTTVNMKPLKANEPWPIYNGDTVTLGNLAITVRFESPQEGDSKKR